MAPWLLSVNQRFQPVLSTQGAVTFGPGQKLATFFSAKDLTVGVLGFAGHLVSMATTQCCHRGVEAAIEVEERDLRRCAWPSVAIQ